MTRLWLCLALVACARGDDVATFHAEATALVAYYRPVADELDRRLGALLIRGPKLVSKLPGSDDANAARLRAERRAAALRQAVGGPGPGELARRADELAAAHDAVGLARLVDLERARLAEDAGVITAELSRSEAWLVCAEAIVSATR